MATPNPLPKSFEKVRLLLTLNDHTLITEEHFSQMIDDYDLAAEPEDAADIYVSALTTVASGDPTLATTWAWVAQGMKMKPEVLVAAALRRCLDERAADDLPKTLGLTGAMIGEARGSVATPPMLREQFIKYTKQMALQHQKPGYVMGFVHDALEKLGPAKLDLRKELVWECEKAVNQVCPGYKAAPAP